MKSVIGTALLIGALVFIGQQPARAQEAQAAPACQDDEEMTKSTLKDLVDLVTEVKKESLGDFEKSYHQKTFISKASFGVTVVTGLVSCLDKAAQDSASGKDQAAAYKTKSEGYAKLKARIEQARGGVKSADQKDAKSQIEKLDVAI
jgi:hypothetical protein